MRQNPMFFPLGGGTLAGCSKPGEIVWSRVFIMDGILHVDLGRGHVVDLPAEETQRRLDATNPEWPIMHAVLHGVSREEHPRVRGEDRPILRGRPCEIGNTPACAGKTYTTEREGTEWGEHPRVRGEDSGLSSA